MTLYRQETKQRYICGSFNWTGGCTYRDLAAMRCAKADLVGIDPLDAPDYLPAGSCNSADYHDWTGDFLVGQTSILREQS